MDFEIMRIMNSYLSFFLTCSFIVVLISVNGLPREKILYQETLTLPESEAISLNLTSPLENIGLYFSFIDAENFSIVVKVLVEGKLNFNRSIVSNIELSVTVVPNKPFTVVIENSLNKSQVIEVQIFATKLNFQSISVGSDPVTFWFSFPILLTFIIKKFNNNMIRKQSP